MKPSLDRCRYRWAAAAKDLYDLSLDMADTLKRYGDPISFGNKANPKGDGMIAVVSGMMPIPIEWNRRIAHIIYDLRSTLDHLVFQLYVASNGRRPQGKIAKGLQFPITHWRSSRKGRANGFDAQSSKLLAGIDTRFVRIIRDHQPYRKGLGRRHALSMLEELSNLDKHRDDYLLLFGAADFHVAARGVNAYVRSITQLTDLRRPLKVGTELAIVHTVRRRTGQYGVQMKTAGTVQPAFANGLFVLPTLQTIFQEVGTILQRCANEVGPDMWAPVQGPIRPRRSRGPRLLPSTDLTDAERAALDALGSPENGSAIA